MQKDSMHNLVLSEHIHTYIYNYAKFKIFILIIYKMNNCLKSVFTLKAFQDFFSGVKFL